jgi:hypothetical protein
MRRDSEALIGAFPLCRSARLQLPTRYGLFAVVAGRAFAVNRSMTMSELIGPGPNTLIDRAKAIVMKPAETWPVIADEPATPGDLLTRYALPLIAIGPLAGFIGGQLFGFGMFGFSYRPGLVASLTSAIIGLVMGVISVVIVGLVADFLAPKFGGTSDRTSAFKLVVYSMTAAWLAGIFQLVPMLGILGILGLYSLYLFYTGATPIMKVPQDQAISYTAVTVIAAIVLNLIAAALTTAIAGMIFGAAALTGAITSSASSDGEVIIPGVGTIDTGKMEEAAKKLEQASTGEVRPIALSELQALLPASLGAYQRTSIETAGAGAIGSQAEGTYQSGDKTIRLKIVDMSGLGALAGLGSAMGVEQSREDADGYERTGTVDGAMQSEKWNTRDSRGSFGRAIANRFMVEAEGEATSIDELKAAVATIDKGKLESLVR